MKKSYKIPFISVLFLFLGCFVLYADQDIESLKKQIETLNKRVAELEAAQTQRSAQPQQQGQVPDEERWFWDPMSEMERMREQMNQMFQAPFSSQQTPSPGSGLFSRQTFQDYDFNLEETKEGYVIQLDTTGLNKDKIDIQINQHSITISAESSSKAEEKNPRGSMYAQTLGTFMKTIPLPVDADPEKLETRQQDTTLTIKIPKKKI